MITGAPLSRARVVRSAGSAWPLLSMGANTKPNFLAHQPNCIQPGSKGPSGVPLACSSTPRAIRYEFEQIGEVLPCQPQQERAWFARDLPRRLALTTPLILWAIGCLAVALWGYVPWDAGKNR